MPGRRAAGCCPCGPTGLAARLALPTTGSNNFPTRVYQNLPDLIDWLAAEMLKYGVMPELECFDLSPILKAKEMQAKGQIKGRPMCNS